MTCEQFTPKSLILKDHDFLFSSVIHHYITKPPSGAPPGRAVSEPTLLSGLSVGGAEDFGGGDYRVGVDGDGVFDPVGVPTGKGHHDGDVAGAGGAVAAGAG